MLLFDLTIHVGTVIAIFIVFRKSLAAFLKNLLDWRRYGTSAIDIYKKSPSVHLLVLAIVATAVTGVLGILLKDYFISARGYLTIVAWMWIINGTLLLITDWRKKTRLGLRQFGMLAAMVVGIAQAAAIMPGISRSGATICAAILIGLHRRWAVEFSFLIAIPAILGASAIECIQQYAVLKAGSLPISSAFIGSAVAAAMGILTLKLLIRVARTAKFRFFALYCYILAFVVLIYLLI
jgi:undecaprenyl-diphosphatase